MELVFTFLLFAFVSIIAVVSGMKFWARPKAAMERITDSPHTRPARTTKRPREILENLLRRVGSVFPASTKGPGPAGKLLVQAGFRHPHAHKFLYGSKLLFALASPAFVVVCAGAAGKQFDASMLPLVGLAGFMAPGFYVRRKAMCRKRRIRRGLPDALDLLVICVESGLGLDHALLQTAKELRTSHPAISEEFTLVNLELKTGRRRAEALRNLGERTGLAELKKLVAVLIQAEQFGTSVAQSLRTHADFMRIQSRQAAEEKAAKLGVKLVFPIFFFILPTLFVVTVGPVAVRIVRELLPMMNNL